MKLPNDEIIHYVRGKDGVFVDIRLTELVRCKDCRWYDPPYIDYNDGTRKDYPKATNGSFG